MNTRDLQAFVAVVDSGSMVAAAAKLHLTQPGLTRRVQNLETLLGMPLLDRQSKPLKPTAAGRDVYALARNVLGAVDELMAAGAPDSEPSGELRIGVPPFLSELALEQPIDRLRDAFPRLTLRVTAGWSPALMQGIERGTLDVAAVMVPVVRHCPIRSRRRCSARSRRCSSPRATIRCRTVRCRSTRCRVFRGC